MASEGLGVAESWYQPPGQEAQDQHTESAQEGLQTHPAPGDGFPNNRVSLPIYHQDGSMELLSEMLLLPA